MSLINQMLKDLEKRRSRDLETSDSLSRNISWETRPASNSFDWRTFVFVGLFLFLTLMLAYLLWERTSFKSQAKTEVVNAESNKVTPQKQVAKLVKPSQETVKPAVTTAARNEAPGKVVKKTYTPVIETSHVVDTEELENDRPANLEKTRRPLNPVQQAEVAYNKGYQLLQQARMHQGEEYLRKALSLYPRHLKAREMLAGIYIKSGRYVEAAELLNKGVKIAPDYPLFAKLYARVLLEQNNPQQAIKVLEQGLTTAEVAPDYNALLAATYQRVQEHEKAIDIYLKLLKFQPSVGVWWLGLAISLEKSGKQKEALDAYQRAQETGSLNVKLLKFSNNRVTALKEIGFPVN